VLETVEYVADGTDVWLELTALLIPGKNDSRAELEALCQWVVEKIGPDVPLHFTAFRPEWKMRNVPATPVHTLALARSIALEAGVRYAYTGNVHDSRGNSTYCHSCGELLIERDWYEMGRWNVTPEGCCPRCATVLAGVFEAQPGSWGSRRQPVRIVAARNP